MNRSVALCLFATALTACTDTPSTAPRAVPPDAHPIVNGTPTGDLYASVGALLFDFDRNGLSGDDEWCSGSLIAPTVFLTAAHCVVSSFTPPGTQFYVSFAPDLYASDAVFIKATGYVYHPQYGHDRANLNDLALVFLPAGSTSGLTPYRLPTLGELDALFAAGALNDAIFINVGYGTSASRTGPPSFPYDGLRKWTESEFMALVPNWLGLLMNTSATGLGGDCYGDSGGPKFLASNPDVVYAVVVTGDFPCRATTWDYRTDTQSARSFLGQYVALP
jgi:secreted trypsin-like serine protease